VDARPTEDQLLIRETAERLARALGPETPAALSGTNDGAAAWARLAETGLLGLRLPEEAGGSALSSVAIALVAEQLGRFCVPLPFAGSAVCASELLRRAGAPEAVLGAMASGALCLSPVLDRALLRWAEPGEPGIAFESRGAAAGLLLDPRTRRLSAVALGPALDGQDLTRELRAVAADAPKLNLGDLGGPLPEEAPARALVATLAALAADLVGVMQAALDLAVGYAAHREQFGVKVGSFQALQHMAAEALVSIEAARGCAYYAAWAVDALPLAQALEAAHTAKAYSSEHAREVCETAILTWEAMPHVYLRRSLLGRLALGDEGVHYARLANVRLGQAEASR
jgi:alkylation response protein AidB-like acyl-CoA dehydrogenase